MDRSLLIVILENRPTCCTENCFIKDYIYLFDQQISRSIRYGAEWSSQPIQSAEDTIHSVNYV